MKQYPKYKDSKISWLGDVPEHWKRLRYKDILVPKDIRVGNNPSYTLLSLTKQGVIVRDLSEGKGKFPKDFDTYKVVEPDDFILCLFDVDETPRTVGVANNYGMITGAYDIFSVLRCQLRYLYYHYLSLDDKKCLKPLYKGLRKTIPLPRLLSAYIYLPPTDEQQAIVDFLDKAVEKIDRYIAAKEAEIEKLGTLKQSIISQAVTKGLDPNATMKDSGIDWIGSIPKHWEIHSIKQHFCIQKRIAGKEGYDVFSITQNGLKIKDISNNDGQMAANYSGYQFVYPGNFAMNHMDLITGGVGLAAAFGVTSPDYRVFELFDNNNCHSEYYLRIFQICYWRRIFYRYGRGAASTGRWRLPAKAFLNFQIPMPPIKEQEEIVKYINEQTEKIDSSIVNIRQQIEKLKTYKQRLISDAVTGKIDVRNAKNGYNEVRSAEL